MRSSFTRLGPEPTRLHVRRREYGVPVAAADADLTGLTSATSMGWQQVVLAGNGHRSHPRLPRYPPQVHGQLVDVYDSFVW